jgi:hypothetical protein
MNKLFEVQERLLEEGLRLEKRYTKYLGPIREAYKEVRGTDVPDHIIGNTARCLENLNTWFLEKGIDPTRPEMYLMETTNPLSVGTFVNYGFDIISALMPALVVEDIVSVQAMDREVGQIFYLNFVRGTTKGGSFTQGQDALNAQTGVNYSTTYTSDDVTAEVGDDQPDGSTTVLTHTLAFLPAIAGTVNFATDESTPKTGVDNGAGGWTSTALSGGSINYTTGAISLTFSSAPAGGSALTFTYRYDMDSSDPISTVELDLEVTASTITAIKRRLRSNWLMDASFSLQKAHGRDVEKELMNAVLGVVNSEISQEIMGQLRTLNTQPDMTAWDKTPSAVNIAYYLHKLSLIDRLVEGSNQIWGSTHRAHGNVVIGGMDFCNVVETLGSDYWKPASYNAVPVGPHFLGTLSNRWKVYKNDNYPTSAFTLGFKGDSWLDAAYVYGPYIPIYTTPPVALDDLKVRRGTGTSYGRQFVNTLMWVEGSIIES